MQTHAELLTACVLQHECCMPLQRSCNHLQASLLSRSPCMSTPGHFSFVPFGACGVNHFGLCLDFLPFSPVPSFHLYLFMLLNRPVVYQCYLFYVHLIFVMGAYTYTTSFLTRLFVEKGDFYYYYFAV